MGTTATCRDGWIEDLLLVLLGRPGAERLAGRADDAAEEVVLRLHEAIRHLEAGVDDLLPFRRSLAVRRERLVDGLGELADGLERGLLAALDRLEHLLGQLRGLVGDRHLNPVGQAAMAPQNQPRSETPATSPACSATA